MRLLRYDYGDSAEIGYAAGFLSKETYHRNFVKITGKTPEEERCRPTLSESDAGPNIGRK